MVYKVTLSKTTDSLGVSFKKGQDASVSERIYADLKEQNAIEKPKKSVKKETKES